MALDHALGLGASDAPERDPAILAAAGEAPVRQGRDGVDRALVEAQHGLGRAFAQTPEDDRLVEGAADGERPVVADGEGAHRAAMAAQLLRSGGRREERQRGGHPEPGDARLPPRHDQFASHQAPSRRMKASPSASAASVTYSSGWCAWSMEPGPQTTVGTPARWNAPASVP